MPKVTIDGFGDTTCSAGRRLVLAIEEAGVDILHRCGGNARCTTCRVEILEGDAGTPTEPEAAKLAVISDATPNLRLSCQVQVNSDMTVRVIRRLKDNPEMADPGSTPIEWPADRALPPE
jgi:ferredoxin